MLGQLLYFGLALSEGVFWEIRIYMSYRVEYGGHESSAGSVGCVRIVGIKARCPLQLDFAI